LSGRAAAHDRRQRRLLVGLALLFFAPLGVSFYLYYGHSRLLPGGRVNRGDLVLPPRPVPSLALPLADSGSTDPDFLRRKWTLLYLGSGGCTESCRRILYETRQVRLALDRDLQRVQRVFIANGDCCDMRFLHEQHPDLITIRADETASPLLDQLPSVDGVSPAVAERVYVIDPLGNLMMSYAPGAKPKGLLEDMKRLLKLSHIG
jgi:cytochrome oxidase Cu insertion factor (SCO1/SenC/PrrC family)